MNSQLPIQIKIRTIMEGFVEKKIKFCDQKMLQLTDFLFENLPNTLPPPIPDFSLHSKQFLTAHVHTNLRHCLRIPPEDIFFSASRSAKFRDDAKISTSAITTNLCKNEIATSMGIPCVGSKTSNSF